MRVDCVIVLPKQSFAATLVSTAWKALNKEQKAPYEAKASEAKEKHAGEMVRYNERKRQFDAEAEERRKQWKRQKKSEFTKSSKPRQDLSDLVFALQRNLMLPGVASISSSCVKFGTTWQLSVAVDTEGEQYSVWLVFPPADRQRRIEGRITLRHPTAPIHLRYPILVTLAPNETQKPVWERCSMAPLSSFVWPDGRVRFALRLRSLIVWGAPATESLDAKQPAPPLPMQVSAVESGWTCSQCTFINPAQSVACDMCAAARHSPSAPEPSSQVGPSSTSEDAARSGKLEEQKGECTICLSTINAPTALGCGHVFCASCCREISECAMCRAPIVTRLRLFM